VRNFATIFDASRIWWALVSKRCKMSQIWNIQL